VGDKTKIEWTDATWNPVTGCTKVSAGCKFCYAERDFNRPYPGRAFTDVRTHPDRLDQPLRWRRPRRVFVNSMGDLFHDKVEDDFLDECFAVMALADKHTFQILTKRPERMLRYFGPSDELDGLTRDCLVEGTAQKLYFERTGENPDQWLAVHWPVKNVWFGVSVEDQVTADERIPLLLKTPATVRFVSYEPALGPVDLTRSIPCGYYCDESVGHVDHGPNGNLAGIDWVIAGGESGPQARPSDPDWFRSVRDQCQASGVPFFFKQWGEWAPVQYHHDGKAYLKISVPMPDAMKPSMREIVWDGANLARVGKKSAGRLLDGREWSEYPNGGKR